MFLRYTVFCHLFIYTLCMCVSVDNKTGNVSGGLIFIFQDLSAMALIYIDLNTYSMYILNE